MTTTTQAAQLAADAEHVTALGCCPEPTPGEFAAGQWALAFAADTLPALTS
jgi:hypothetical protein